MKSYDNILTRCGLGLCVLLGISTSLNAATQYTATITNSTAYNISAQFQRYLCYNTPATWTDSGGEILSVNPGAVGVFSYTGTANTPYRFRIEMWGNTNIADIELETFTPAVVNIVCGTNAGWESHTWNFTGPPVGDQIFRLTVYHQPSGYGCTNPPAAQVIATMVKQGGTEEQTAQSDIPVGASQAFDFTIDEGAGNYLVMASYSYLRRTAQGFDSPASAVIFSEIYNYSGYPGAMLLRSVTVKTGCGNVADSLFSGTTFNNTNSMGTTNLSTNTFTAFNQQPSMNATRGGTSLFPGGATNENRMGFDGLNAALDDVGDRVDAVRTAVENNGTTLKGMSNLVAGLGTNAPGTNMLADQVESAQDQAESKYASLKTYSEEGGQPVGGSGAAPGTWLIPLGTGVFSIDLSPMQFQGSGAFFSTIKGMMAWTIMAVLFMKNWKCLDKGIKAVYWTPQARSAGTSVMGTSMSAIGAITMAGAIVAAASVIPTWAINHMDKSFLGGPPEGSSIGQIFMLSLYYINLICPYPAAVAAVVSHVFFRMGMTYVVTVAMTVTKLLVGI